MKNTVPWTYGLSMISMVKKLLELQQEFRIEKVIKRKGDKLYIKWKGYDNSFNSWIDKKDLAWFYCIKNESVFSKTVWTICGDINVKVDLWSYATKADNKNISHVHTSSFALQINLACLKAEVYIDKLAPGPVDLSKLSDVVKNVVVKKTAYDKLVSKVNSIGTSNFVLKTNYDIDKTKLEHKTPDTCGLVKKTDYNIKITEIENKLPDVSSSATKVH